MYGEEHGNLVREHAFVCGDSEQAQFAGRDTVDCLRGIDERNQSCGGIGSGHWLANLKLSKIMARTTP